MPSSLDNPSKQELADKNYGFVWLKSRIIRSGIFFGLGFFIISTKMKYQSIYYHYPENCNISYFFIIFMLVTITCHFLSASTRQLMPKLLIFSTQIIAKKIPSIFKLSHTSICIMLLDIIME